MCCSIIIFFARFPPRRSGFRRFRTVGVKPHLLNKAIFLMHYSSPCCHPQGPCSPAEWRAYDSSLFFKTNKIMADLIRTHIKMRGDICRSARRVYILNKIQNLFFLHLSEQPYVVIPFIIFPLLHTENNPRAYFH